MKRALAVLLLSGCLAGCGSNAPVGPPNPNGNWSFTFTPNSSGSTLLATGALQELEGGLSGLLTVNGTPCSSSADLSGSLGPGTAVNFQLQVVEQVVGLSGTFASNGLEMSGTYAVGAAGGCTSIGNGTWIATKCTSSCPSFEAQVRFVNALPNAGAMDISVNGTKIFTNIAFFGYQPSSGYSEVPTGSVTVEGLATGTNTQIFSSTANLTSGQYTMIASGSSTGNSGSGVNLLSIPNTNPAPRIDSVEFRVIDASQAQGNVDIYLNEINGQAFISGLAYMQASNYINIIYGNSYTLYVTAAGSTNPLFSQPLGTWAYQSIHTIVLTDAANGSSINTQAIVLDDYN